jgi:hypothetical protein
MEDGFERVKAMTLTTLDPIADVEKEPASSLPIPTLQTKPQQQEASGSSYSDESKIVCLGSSRDEEAAGAEATGQVEVVVVASGRYNLRRGASRRPSELDIISEEAAAAAAAESATSNNKRSREEGSEESSDQEEQAGPSQ